MKPISLCQTDNSATGIRKILKPIEKNIREKIKNQKEIVIKINFVSAMTELATTPFDTVKAFVDWLIPFYKGEIIIAEEATLGQSRIGFARFGFKQLAKENKQVKLLNSAQSPSEKITIKYPHGEIQLPLAKIYTQSPFVVSICRAKTHDAVVVTLSIKNLLVGAIQQKISFNRQKIHQGKYINWILAELAQHTMPDLSIIDGIIGMQGNGPVSGFPIESNWMIASMDALAADSAAATIMGFNLSDIGYFNLIREKNLGMLYSKDKIKVIGPSLEKIKTPYQPHDSFESQRKWQ